MWSKENREKMYKKINNNNNKFKINNLFTNINITSNFFDRFNSFIYRLNHLKIYKLFNNFNYI